MVASATSVKIIFLYNFVITNFDHEGGSQGGGISDRAFTLARHVVAPPLSLTNVHVPEVCNFV